jgi:hypothetical protein
MQNPPMETLFADMRRDTNQGSSKRPAGCMIQRLVGSSMRGSRDPSGAVRDISHRLGVAERRIKFLGWALEKPGSVQAVPADSTAISGRIGPLPEEAPRLGRNASSFNGLRFYQKKLRITSTTSPL